MVFVHFLIEDERARVLDVPETVIGVNHLPKRLGVLKFVFCHGAWAYSKTSFASVHASFCHCPVESKKGRMRPA